MRLIDADELIEHVWRDRVDSRERIANLVESMPTIKETRGAWQIGKFSDDDHRYNDWSYRCNQCGEVVFSTSRYCPNCGVKMKGGKDVCYE